MRRRMQSVVLTFPLPGVVLNGVDSAGDIVGAYGDHGSLDSGGVFSSIDVPFVGASFTMIKGINDLGQIVGTYFADGQEHGFLATPIPEPAPLVLLTFGLFATGRRRPGSPTLRDRRCFPGRGRTTRRGGR